MILVVLAAVPLLAGMIILLAGRSSVKFSRTALVLSAITYFVLTGVAGWLYFRGMPLVFEWQGNILFKLDDTGFIVLFITALLFCASAFQSVKWLPMEYGITVLRHDGDTGIIRRLFMAEHIFAGCLTAFVGTMTLVIISWNLGVMWVAVEATTLVSAPLVSFRRSGRSLEAMWKYLLICSVGIALALFGTMIFSVAVSAAEGESGLWLEPLFNGSTKVDPGWFKGAFIFILAGYGTKMGLAPFHTWLPDDHSEAPDTISGLFSGALLNCSLLAILRFMDIAPEPLKGFCRTLLAALGLLSLTVAAFLIIRQGDFKRMLAYSSVEHMGIIAMLCGIGMVPTAMLHMVGHSLIKMTLFLTSGNMLLAYGSRSIAGISGMLGKAPRNAVLWLLGILLICGTPPSPLFVTEFILVLKAPLWFGITVAVLLFAVFAGMTQATLQMLMGKNGSIEGEAPAVRAAEKLIVIPACMATVAVLLGVFVLWLINIDIWRN